MKQTLTLIIFLFGLYVIAQNTVTGKVVNTNNNPISLVNISISGTTQGVASDNDGNFKITDLPNGNYTLYFSAVGYYDQEKKVFINDTNLELTVALTIDVTELQTVEITGRKATTYKNTLSFSGTKTATALKDLPQQIQYVSKELILDQGAFTLNDVLKNVSGANQYSFYNDISIRGFRVQGQRNSGNLVNGLRAFTSFWKQSLIPHIERVEVIKGPSSALFGNASPGGVINRVTKKPLDENRQFISASVGSFGTTRALADFTGPLNKDKTLLYRLNLGYENTDGFRDLQFGRNLIIAPSFSFLPSDNTRLNIDLVYQDSKGRLDRGQAVFGNGNLKSVPITRSLSATNDFLNELNLNATIAFQHKFSDHITFNSTYLRSTYDEDLLEHRTSNQFARNGNGTFDETRVAMRVFIRKRSWSNDNFNNYFNFKFDTGEIKLKLLVGYDYFEQKLEPGGSQLEARSYLLANGTATNTFNPDNAAAYVLDADGNPVTNVGHFDLTSPTANALRDMTNYVYRTRNFNQFLQRSHGVYLQDQIEYKKLKLLLGLRREFFTDFVNYDTEAETESEQSAWIPRVGLVYELTPDINLYGTWVKGCQPQAAADVQNPDAGGPFDALRSQLFELGAKAEFFEKRLAVSMAVYHLTEKGSLYDAGDPENPELLRQFGEEEAKGIEFDVVGRIMPNWSLTASYAFNEAEITESDNNSRAIIGVQKPNAPKHSGNLWTKYVIDHGKYNGLGVGFGYNFVTERNGSLPASNAVEDIPVFPSYGIFDAALYYKINKVQFQVNFNNLFNKTHWVGGYDFIRAFPGAPRNVLTTVSYTF